MHAIDVLDDVVTGLGAKVLDAAMRIIADEGRGVVVLLRENQPTKLSDRVRLLNGPAQPGKQLRDYGIGAQILLDLGVKDMVLLSNSQRTLIGLEGYGLNVVERRQLGVTP
jgi:3,4-dihydroxy 2-butanone 4-phosphate synthase/GTP cyclohydrolase II